MADRCSLLVCDNLRDELPGLLLISLGAGLLLHTATNFLRRVVDPSGRLGHGASDQRRGAPDRRCARGGGNRQRGIDPSPRSHDGCSERPGRRITCDPCRNSGWLLALCPNRLMSHHPVPNRGVLRDTDEVGIESMRIDEAN